MPATAQIAHTVPSATVPRVARGRWSDTTRATRAAAAASPTTTTPISSTTPTAASRAARSPIESPSTPIPDSK